MSDGLQYNRAGVSELHSNFSLKELCHAPCMLKIIAQFCYLKVYVISETGSCRLFLRMARMAVD